jgi:hypothetical protein
LRGNISQEMERVHCQVVYVFRLKIQINWGSKDGKIPFLRSPKQLLPADQDKNENENRFCA